MTTMAIQDVQIWTVRLSLCTICL